MYKIILGNTEKELYPIEKESINLVYLDPPYNTGNKRKLGNIEYKDTFDNYQEFIEPILLQLYSLLKSNGSLFIQLDYREIHYVKVLLDSIFALINGASF